MKIGRDEAELDREIPKMARQALRRAEAEVAGVPEHLRARHFVRTACEHVIRMLETEGVSDVALHGQLRVLIERAQRLQGELRDAMGGAD
jgi:hypothetical protein